MKIAGLVLMILLAQTAFAQVSISEVKYTGNEWIEVFNAGTLVDISLWKFFEGGANHKLKPIQGGVSVPANGYAVIANNAAAFLSEHIGFSGVLFDSSFSLLDVGETISLKSSDLNMVDTVSYTGIKGSKNSTQKIGSTWYESVPTPGFANALSQNSNTSTQNTNSVSVSSVQTGGSATVTSSVSKASVTAEAGPRTRVVLAGAPITFEGKTLGFENTYGGVHASWSFGDGAVAEGATVSHTYYYPGEYTAVLDVVSGSVIATDRMLVRVILPDILLTVGGDTARSFVVIENRGGDELDLSGWQMIVGEKYFTFPKNTILGARKSSTFASEVTGLVTPEGSAVELRFPNGTKVATKSQSKTEVAPVVAVNSKIVAKAKQEPKVSQVREFSATKAPLRQEATVLGALTTSAPGGPRKEEEGSLWPWYIGAAFLAAVALIALRLTRDRGEKDALTADEFEIVEDKEPY